MVASVFELKQQIDVVFNELNNIERLLNIDGKKQQLNECEKQLTECWNNVELTTKLLKTKTNLSNIIKEFEDVKNNILYVYKGTGDHQVKEYLRDGNIVKPALCSVLSEFLENSIENENNDELIPVSTSTITKTLYTYSDETKDPQELLNNLDMNLSYNNTPRYTPEESQIRHELDIAYRNLQKTQESLARTEKYKKDSDDKVQSLINNIQIYSSETTFYQICVSAKVWQAPAGINPFDEPSDKQIREKYTQSLNPQTTNLDNNNQNENRSGPKRK